MNWNEDKCSENILWKLITVENNNHAKGRENRTS